MRRRILALAALLAGAPAMAAEDPLLKPIQPDYAQRWMAPQGPIHVYGNTWLVGPAGMDVGLIRTSAGLMLIDGAMPQAVPMIEANLKALGLSIRNVKWIFSTEPHWDHASGMAALARDSGATVIASEAAAKEILGTPDPADPQAGGLERYPAPARVRTFRDGETVRLGDVTVTAHATPGHTAGSMSWSWTSCEGQRCLATVFAASLNPVARDGYRFTDPGHAAVVRNFRTTFPKVRAFKCDVLLSSHPDQSGVDRKIAALATHPAANPFIDPGACRAYADKLEKVLDDKIAAEKAH